MENAEGAVRDWMTATPAQLRSSLTKGLRTLTHQAETCSRVGDNLGTVMETAANVMRALTATINLGRLVTHATAEEEDRLPVFLRDDESPLELWCSGMFLLTNTDFQLMAEIARAEADGIESPYKKAPLFADPTPTLCTTVEAEPDVVRHARNVLASLQSDGELGPTVVNCLTALLVLVMALPATTVESVLLLDNPSLYGCHRVTHFTILYTVYLNVAALMVLLKPSFKISACVAQLGFREDEFPTNMTPFWLVRAVQARSAGRVQYRGGDYLAALTTLSFYAGHLQNVVAPIDTIPAEALNEATLRLAFFHRGIHKACEWVDSQQWLRAVYTHETPHQTIQRLRGPGVFQQSELIQHMVSRSGQFELDNNSKRHLFDITNMMMLCHGDAAFFAEMNPFLDIQPVVVLDVVSCTPWRGFAKYVDSLTPLDIVTKPELLADPKFIGRRSWDMIRSVLCINYVFLFSFVVCAVTGNNAFTSRCINVFPETYPPSAVDAAMNGAIQIVGHNFYVRLGAKYIDCGNDPNLLVDVMFRTMVQSNNAYKNACQRFHYLFHSMYRSETHPPIEPTSPYECGATISDGTALPVPDPELERMFPVDLPLMMPLPLQPHQAPGPEAEEEDDYLEDDFRGNEDAGKF